MTKYLAITAALVVFAGCGDDENKTNPSASDTASPRLVAINDAISAYLTEIQSNPQVAQDRDLAKITTGRLNRISESAPAACVRVLRQTRRVVERVDVKPPAKRELILTASAGIYTAC